MSDSEYVRARNNDEGFSVQEGVTLICAENKQLSRELRKVRLENTELRRTIQELESRLKVQSEHADQDKKRRATLSNEIFKDWDRE